MELKEVILVNKRQKGVHIFAAHWRFLVVLLFKHNWLVRVRLFEATVACFKINSSTFFRTNLSVISFVHHRNANKTQCAITFHVFGTRSLSILWSNQIVLTVFNSKLTGPFQLMKRSLFAPTSDILNNRSQVAQLLKPEEYLLKLKLGGGWEEGVLNVFFCVQLFG
jgi:hypothetical protein